MIDSHCHIDFDVYDGRRDEIVKDALENGIHTIVNIGVDLQSSIRSIELSEEFESVYATVGIHPHDAKKLNKHVLEQLRILALKPKVVAIGEIGLDFYRNLSPKDIQVDAFRKQLELAIEINKPIVIHTRDSFSETLAIVREYASDLKGGVFHCFPGNADDAKSVIELGFVVSVGGVVTFKNSSMASMAEEVPLDKIIIETDSPYLTPVPFRGKTNSPAHVRFVCEKLAEIKNLSFQEVEKITDRTCNKLYRFEETFEG